MPPPRTIRPIQPVDDALPIVAATLKGCITLDGAPFGLDALPGLIETRGPGILATNDSHRVTLYLEDYFHGHPRWQVKVTVREGTIARHDDRIRIRKTVIGFVGLKRKDAERGKHHYWHILDPSIFLDDAKAGMDLYECALWAADVQAWCIDNGVRIRPTAGGVAAQLLRHPRFYPEPRRKVPGATNERARLALPGNHYELRARRDKKYVADYLDQHSAHHHAALTTPLPDADVYAFGHYHEMRDRPWVTLDDLNGGVLGLLHARISVPPRHVYPNRWDTERYAEEFRPRWASDEGSRLAYIYTNELDLLHDLGGHVEYVTAAWLSDTTDKGLPAYAEWSLAETATASPERRDWLKRMLLTPYGILAAKPQCFEVGWRNSRGKHTAQFPIGGRMVEFTVRRTNRPVHPRIAHVIQRGMIEAETRKLSITFANQLLAEGEHVLCIYSDGMLVRTRLWEGTRGLLPNPFRWKGRLTNLHFISEQAFESREVVRLPGIPVAGRQRTMVSD